jgi:uncharacterized protein
VVAYISIIQGCGLAFGVDTSGASTDLPDAEAVVRNGLLPIGLSVLFGIGVTTWLGWWPEVVHERKAVQRWVRFVPISMLAVAILSVNYGHLVDQQTSFVLSLIAMCALVGVGEELMFRGLGVNVFRKDGFSEAKVALWSSVVFGLVHLSNGVWEGPAALAQAAIVCTSGYFFYLARRAAGTIVVPMLVHGLWDFALLSSLTGTDKSAYFGPFLIVLVQVVLIVVLIRRRHRIEPSVRDAAMATA